LHCLEITDVGKIVIIDVECFEMDATINYAVAIRVNIGYRTGDGQ
jgi:hypothetical protein